MTKAGSAVREPGPVPRDTLTSSDIAELLESSFPQVSSADLLAFARHLLGEIYEGLRRGARVCIAGPAPSGALDISCLVIEEPGKSRQLP